jgi:CRISPR-associated endoribonuclease Cas6
MRFNITLSPLTFKPTVPFSYQYALSAVIYRKLAEADKAYAEFLHEKGYAGEKAHKNFKFFTFSSLWGIFKPVGGGLQMVAEKTGFTLCCHMPEFAQHFITGLFRDQQITIAGSGVKAVFMVEQVEALPPSFGTDVNIMHRVTLNLLSPLVVTRSNEKGNEDYLSPADADFIPLLKLNLLDKLMAAFGENYEGLVTINASYEAERLKSRLVTIKEGTSAETRVRGFTGFTLEMIAPGKVIQLALDAGAGSMNSIGFGSLEEQKGDPRAAGSIWCD